MSAEKEIINATPLIERLEFTKGVSKKTSNPYLVGAVFIKSPISDTPLRIGLDYINDNDRALIEMAVKKLNAAEQDNFKEGIED